MNGWILGYIPIRLLNVAHSHWLNKYYLYNLAIQYNPWVGFCFDKNGMKAKAVDSLSEIHKAAAIDFSGDKFLYKMARERIVLKYRLPKLCVFILKRHRELKYATIASQVDKWLIDNKLDAWSKS